MSLRHPLRPVRLSALHEACRPILEPLEKRTLFTTLFGGERAHFQDAQGNAIEIVLGGNITAEFIGSNVDDLNDISLNDLPMTIVSGDRAGTRLNGGFGAREAGVQVIGGTSINDPINGLNGLIGSAVNLQALAVNAAGQTFAFNIAKKTVDVLIPDPNGVAPPAEDDRIVNVVQLVLLNNNNGGGTVIWSLEDQLPSGPVIDPPILDDTGNDLLRASRVRSIEAADVGPDGEIYFVALIEEDPIISGGAIDTGGDDGGQATDTAVPRLFRVNPATGVVTAIPGTFGMDPNNPDQGTRFDIKSITFDNNGTLIGFAVVTPQDGDPSGRIFAIPLGSTNAVGTGVAVQLDGQNVQDISAIEVLPGDNTFIYAIRNAGANSVLLRIRRGNGSALEMGPVDIEDSATGRDIEGIAFNPTLTNPFTGETGVLLGTDQSSDQLLYIDTRNRFPKSNLFTIYVSEADADSYIAIGQIPAADAESAAAVMTPFTGSTGSFRVNDNQMQSAETILVNAPANTGVVLIGAKTRDIPEVTGEDLIPLTSAPVTQNFGVLPSGFTELTAGIMTADNTAPGRFLLGGTLMGTANFEASTELVYVGWLATGYAEGLNRFQTNQSQAPFVQDNFRVNGELRNLITSGPVGTDDISSGNEPRYRTGVDIQVTGQIGWIQGLDGFTGSIQVENSRDVPRLDGRPTLELEVPGDFLEDGEAFAQGMLKKGDTWLNDSFETAQYVGTQQDGGRLGIGVDGVVISGTLFANADTEDFRDWYAVPLMAGQTIRVQLIYNGFPPPPRIGVFNPDNELIASDYSNLVDHNLEEFVVTADRTGVYRIAVTLTDDPDFSIGGEFDDPIPDTDKPYLITIKDVGNLAMGGMTLNGNFYDAAQTAPLLFENGHLGAFEITGSYMSDTVGSVIAANGDIRAFIAGQIGSRGTTLGNGVHPEASGNIGLMRSTSGEFVINNLYTLFPPPPIGGSYGMLQSADAFGGRVWANGGLGQLLVAGSMDTIPATDIVVNADNQGFDGIIDLIEVQGDFGVGGVGGPQITTNTGGDVRYIRVHGEVYRDIAFGTATPQMTGFLPGQSVRLVDDSGAVIELSPGTPTSNPAYNPNDPESTEPQFLDSPTLSSITTYGIRGSGGSVIIEVVSSGDLTARSTASQSGAAVQIGRLVINGEGTVNSVALPDAVVVPEDPTDPTDPDPAVIDTPASLDIEFSGDARIDIFELTGGHINSLINRTRGEIVSLMASSVGTLRTRGSLGVSDRAQGSVLRPSSVLSGAFNIFPFFDQRTGIHILGDAVSIESYRALGNIIVGGNAGRIRANSDRSNDASLHEGINAPIVVNGALVELNIGEGVLPSGTGNGAHAGVFVDGRIYSIVNQGLGSDIRGDIVSSTAIDSIRLNNGAIIAADIMILEDWADSREFVSSYFFIPEVDPLSRPVYEIGSITTTGAGGILGTLIVAPDINRIQAGGFGMLVSAINQVGGSTTLNSLRADGYGIRSVTLSGGANVNEIIATGNGSNVAATNFSESARLSQVNMAYNPYTGLMHNIDTDLHMFLGTSAAAPVIDGVTNSGIIEDLDARAQRNLGKLKAYQVRAKNPAAIPSVLNFANQIGTIETSSLINGLSVLTGRLKNFKPATDVFNAHITVAGRIDKIEIKGNYAANSSISSVGPNARIKQIKVRGNYDGEIHSTGAVGKVEIGGNFTGAINIQGKGSRALEKFKLAGSFDGLFNVMGSVGEINTAHSFGNAGDSLTITGNLKKLKVGTNKSLNGASLGMNLTVTSNVDEISVTGTLDGDINVGGKLKKLKVTADAASPGSIVNGTITVGRKIDSISVKDRNIAGSIIAQQDIGKVKFTNATLLAGGLISSVFRNIKDIKVTNGSIQGSLNAGQKIKSVKVSGNLGDGFTPASIGAFQIDKLTIGGSVLSGYTVSVPSRIGSLTIGGNVDAGATISAGSIGRKRISGAINGVVTP